MADNGVKELFDGLKDIQFEYQFVDCFSTRFKISFNGSVKNTKRTTFGCRGRSRYFQLRVQRNGANARFLYRNYRDYLWKNGDLKPQKIQSLRLHERQICLKALQSSIQVSIILNFWRQSMFLWGFGNFQGNFV